MTPHATLSGQAKRDLWIRLKHYHFNHIVPPHLTDHVAAVFGGADASTKAFASKLARKLNWKTPFALQAIDEYKKFIFLGMVSEFAVTPPKVIDQVWHEHILFSRAYRDFCTDILRREFDHHPELVATDAQTAVFQAQYAATLELYEREFNYPPPAAIWGTPKFDANAAEPGVRTLKPKRSVADGRTSSDDAPLYMFVGDSGHDSCGTHHHAGAHSAHHADSGGHHGADAGGHDGGGVGGDSGGADGGGGSGCSSGCGGGGCGSS